jgi:hypothetical protein
MINHDPSEFEVAIDQGATSPWSSEAYEAPGAAGEAVEVLRMGLLVVLAGHKDATRTRVAALAVLVGLFDSPTAAARALALDRSTISRAVRRMRADLRNAATHSNPASNGPEDDAEEFFTQQPGPLVE